MLQLQNFTTLSQRRISVGVGVKLLIDLPTKLITLTTYSRTETYGEACEQILKSMIAMMGKSVTIRKASEAEGRACKWLVVIKVVILLKEILLLTKSQYWW